MIQILVAIVGAWPIRECIENASARKGRTIETVRSEAVISVIVDAKENNRCDTSKNQIDDEKATCKVMNMVRFVMYRTVKEQKYSQKTKAKPIHKMIARIISSDAHHIKQNR